MKAPLGLLLTAGLMTAPALAAAQGCGESGIQLQVLGSGVAGLGGKRAGPSHLLWIEGRPRVLVDVGGGAVLRFGEAGARIADLDAVLFTHLHATHSAGLPALIQSSVLEPRARPLPIYGPAGNRRMPSTVAFVRDLFDPARGAYRHLGELLSPLAKDTYKLEPHDVRERPAKLSVARKNGAEPLPPVFANERFEALAAAVPHGELAALAWRIETGGKIVVFSGDTSGNGDQLVKLARNADLFVAHNVVPEDAAAAERSLYMPPSVIGRIAQEAGVKQLVLSHRGPRTLGHEEEIGGHIRKHYGGPLAFANDLECFQP